MMDKLEHYKQYNKLLIPFSDLHKLRDPFLFSRLKTIYNLGNIILFLIDCFQYEETRKDYGTYQYSVD